MSADTDTIVALATPPGRGGIGVTRLSGPEVPRFAHALIGRLPPPRHAQRCSFADADGRIIDDGLALYFPAPASFTGEHVLELHGHGGPVVHDLLLQRCLALGARLARPGEFSERAFLNDKLDLLQAEAIADLIDSGSAQAARAARRSLQGEFSSRIKALVEGLIEVRSFIEAAIDFPEEEIDFIAESDVLQRLQSLQARLDSVRDNARQGALLREGVALVIVGPPNVGKSSLLNALAGRETAIVTAVPGTTRDVLQERILLHGAPVTVIDTAGLRDSDDTVERIGIDRARAQLCQADYALLVEDDCDALGEAERASFLAQIPQGLMYTDVRNKIDLSGRVPGVQHSPGAPVAAVSARTGAGLEALRGHLAQRLGMSASGEGEFIARRRHLDALDRGRAALAAATDQLRDSGAAELAAEDLRAAQQALGEITGAFTSDDLLGRIFAQFCIGK